MLNLGTNFSNPQCKKMDYPEQKNSYRGVQRKAYCSTENVANDSKLPLLPTAPNSMVGATRRNGN